jgi:hypothetical protein
MAERKITGMDFDESSRSVIEVLSWYSPGGIEGKHKNPQEG